MSSSFSFKTSSFSSLIICISLNVTCERDDFMYRISNPQLLHYNGSKYLGIGIFIDDCFTYNLLCPISISDEQTEQLPPMPKHSENIHRHRSTTGKIRGGVSNVSYRGQFSYMIQCEKAFSLPYPFSKPTDLSYHPLECQTIHQYPWTLKTLVNI